MDAWRPISGSSVRDSGCDFRYKTECGVRTHGRIHRVMKYVAAMMRCMRRADAYCGLYCSEVVGRMRGIDDVVESSPGRRHQSHPGSCPQALSRTVDTQALSGITLNLKSTPSLPGELITEKGRNTYTHKITPLAKDIRIDNLPASPQSHCLRIRKFALFGFHDHWPQESS